MKLHFLWIISFSFFLSGCASAFFHPQKAVLTTPDFFELNYTTHKIKTDDNETLFAWELQADQPKATIIFLHGNAGNISTHLASIFWLPSRGFNVFTADYRGFGASTGKISVEGTLVDVQAIFDFVLASESLSSVPLIVFGQSMGGSLAITALANYTDQERFALLISDGAFASFEQIAKEVAKRSWISWSFAPFLSNIVERKLDPVANIEQLKIPLIIMHGDQDKTIGYHHAYSLHSKANEPKELWINYASGHINYLINRQNRDKFVAKIEKVLGD